MEGYTKFRIREPMMRNKQVFSWWHKQRLSQLYVCFKLKNLFLLSRNSPSSRRHKKLQYCKTMASPMTGIHSTYLAYMYVREEEGYPKYTWVKIPFKIIVLQGILGDGALGEEACGKKCKA